MIRQDWSTLKKLMFAKTAAAGAAVTEATATGNPMTFVTDLARPLKSLLIPFTPIQQGTGDPSPENIRSILPWNGLTVFGGGKNLLNPVAENMIPFEDTSYNRYTLVNGQIITTGNSLVGFLVEVKEQTKYAFSFASEASAILEVFSYSAKPSKIRNADTQIAYSTVKKAGFTTPQGCKYVVCAIVSTVSANVISNFMCEVGQTATAYESFKPITDTDIVFPSPVYGGEHEAVSGKLMDGWAVKVFDGSPDELWDKISGGSASAFAMYIQMGDKSTSADSYMCDSLKNIARNATWGNFDNWISDNQNSIVTGIKAITTVADWRAYLAEHPITICYKLATPTEQTLTGHQITALVGDNTIWSDADGSMTATYLKKG